MSKRSEKKRIRKYFAAIEAKNEPLKRTLVQQLQKTPIVQLACERAGISRATYYRWRSQDNDFARAADRMLASGRFLVNDMAESQLIRKVKEGDFQALRFWLQHNNPRYARKYIHEYCHACETQSVEDAHRKNRRHSRLANIRIEHMYDEKDKKLAKGLEDAVLGLEQNAMERFGILGDESEHDEPTQKKKKPEKEGSGLP